jgi:uncharacterized membrane protein
MRDIKPLSFEELLKLRKPVRNVNTEFRQNLSRLDKLAVWITEKVGSMGFFFLIFGWTAIWLGWNTLGPASARFDPYPAFVLWLFMSNVIQIFLMPLIMVGQNLISDHSEARAAADFDVNTTAETEIKAIILHLEHQNGLILEILQQLKNQQGNNQPG